MRVVSLLSLLAALAFASVVMVEGQEGQPAQGGYRVGVGDVLDVEAFDQDEITGEFAVHENGSITFPLLGDVAVSGKTTAGIAALLETLLEKDFYVDVQIKVEVAEFASQPVTLLGEVERPGTYYLKGETSITQLLAEAGGLKSTAGPELELRRVTRGAAHGEATVMTFSTAKLLTGEQGREVHLEAGDVLSVSAKQMYFITGEVARPGQYEISLGMTLMQALSHAGGTGKFASQTVEVHREKGGEKQILEFDLSHIRKGRVDDPAIQAGDVVIVKRRFF